MADLTDETLANLPPQATGNTPAGQAADLADIAPATTPESALLAANFGDMGALNYQNLRAAGQQAPSGNAAPAPAPSNAVPATAPAVPSGPPTGADVGPISKLLGGGGAFNPSPIYQLLAGPQGIAAAQKQALSYQTAIQEQQQRAQSMAIQGANFLDQLRQNNVPLDVRVALIHGLAEHEGRTLSPAEAAYIAHLTREPDLIQHLSERIKAGDVNAMMEFQSLFSGDPTKMLDAATAIRKNHAEADRAVTEAEKSRQTLPFAAPQAEAQARLKTAEAARAEEGVKTFYDTPERQAQAEASQRGMSPGDPRYTNYVNARVSDLKRDQAMATHVAQVQVDAANKPLPAASQKSIQEASQAYDMATDLLKLYNDPAVRGNRQALAQRVGDLLKYQYGVDLPPGTDAVIALQSLLDIGASAQFMHGMRNPKFITEYIMGHMPQTADPPERVILKLENMRRFSGRTITNAYDLATSPAGKRQAESERPTPGLPGLGNKQPSGAPNAGSTEISAQDFLNQ